MPQNEVLGRQLDLMSKERDEGPQKESNQADHAERMTAEQESAGTTPGSEGSPIGRGTYAPIRTPYGILATHTHCVPTGRVIESQFSRPCILILRL